MCAIWSWHFFFTNTQNLPCLNLRLFAVQYLQNIASAELCWNKHRKKKIKRRTVNISFLCPISFSKFNILEFLFNSLGNLEITVCED